MKKRVTIWTEMRTGRTASSAPHPVLVKPKPRSYLIRRGPASGNPRIHVPTTFALCRLDLQPRDWWPVRMVFTGQGGNGPTAYVPTLPSFPNEVMPPRALAVLSPARQRPRGCRRFTGCRPRLTEPAFRSLVICATVRSKKQKPRRRVSPSGASSGKSATTPTRSLNPSVCKRRRMVYGIPHNPGRVNPQILKIS